MAENEEFIEKYSKNYFETLGNKLSTQIFKNPIIKHLEIYANRACNIKITFEEGYIKTSNQKSSSGIGLRVIGPEGKEGMTFTSDFSGKALDAISQQCIRMMKASTSNPDFIDLAHPSKNYKEVENTYDSNLENFSPDQINDLIQPIFNLKKRKLQPAALSGSFSISMGTTFVMNSNGISQWEKYSTVGCSSEISLVQNNIPSGGFDWKSTCQLKDLNIEKIAENSYDMALKGLKRESIETGEYPILLSPLAVSHFLISPLTDAINADSIQNNMSFLGEHMNKKIGSENLTIYDNPFIPGKLATESFDAEGIATKELTMVENGVLKNLYHNTYTAGKENIESNGHASRSGYNSKIGISNNNLIIKNGKNSWLDILSDIKKGILFKYTGDSPNNITGDFSGLIMTGYIIKDGEIGPALTETLLGVNLLDAYSQIEEISSERKWIDEVYAPWIKINNITISGRT